MVVMVVITLMVVRVGSHHKLPSFIIMPNVYKLFKIVPNVSVIHRCKKTLNLFKRR